jgi:hypothetical protein
MAKLIYSTFVSVDGYTEVARGRFGWGGPADEALHSYIHQLASSVDTGLYGRRMYETMVYWETARTVRDQPQFVLDFAKQWQAARRSPGRSSGRGSARTRIHREFEPDVVQRLKADTECDIRLDGPELAGQAIRAVSSMNSK